MNQINNKLKKCLIPPRILLSKFRFIDDNSRYSNACLDPYYLPFYYYLGSLYKVKNVLEIGFGLGLNMACYLMGNKNVENYLTIQESKDYYSPRLGIANIKQVWKKKFYVHTGNFHDEIFQDKIKERKWDLVLVSEKRDYDTYMFWFNAIWDEDSMICVDYISSHKQAGRAYRDFCTIKEKEPYIFPTRYGVGLWDTR